VAGRRRGEREAERPAGEASSSLSRRKLAAGALAVLAVTGTVYLTQRPSPEPAPPNVVAPTSAREAPAPAPAPPTYVGSATCAPCHAAEAEKWRGSQHARAMQVATDETVLGDFRGTAFSHGGVTSTFRRDGARFVVRTDGADGALADFDVAYTFGVAPLQQYLVRFPDGRLQALGVAWDTRAKGAGGQRWFHVYPDPIPKVGDPLHWTGVEQRWNYQCADCHSTGLRKGYDAQARRYDTTWAEIDVACEACHGPGSRHVARAKEHQGGGALDLTAHLDERRGVGWTLDPSTGNAARSRPRDAQREIEVCARCHARREQLGDAQVAGDAFADAFRPALLEPGLYHADGQMQGEVYVHGSFLQSKMASKGVTCSDCHEPHTGALRAPGNGVCAQCHAQARYDAPSHHHHAQGSTAAACVACHMPTVTYLRVDARHDHSLRIPRPDRTVTLGTPNACTACHAKEGAPWATDALKRWFPAPNPGFQTFAEAFSLAERGAPGATKALGGVVTDAKLSGWVRASAIARLPRPAPPVALPAIEGALGEAEPLVRAAAVDALAESEPAVRARLLAPRLRDPVRLVRIAAASALAGDGGALSGAATADLSRALDELVTTLRFGADRAESHLNLARVHAAQGRVDAAARELGEALELDGTFAPAAVNLADLESSRGREADAEKVLRAHLARDGGAAVAHHALGLSLQRQKRTEEALGELGAAARLAPDDPRFGYVYGVALHDAGKRPEAIRVLRAVVEKHPWDRDVLLALAAFEHEAGDVSSATARARTLLELDPEDTEIIGLARALGLAH
jgi:predicted CXXCH cytochrome family protein